MPVTHNYLSPLQIERIKDSDRAQSLIDAAIPLFGDYGVKGTTTRMLSDASGANSAAIPYYFGSKEGLYIATMNYVVEQIKIRTDPLMNELSASLKEDLSKEKALGYYQKIMEGFCELFLDDEKLDNWTNLILREHASPTQAYDIFYDLYYERVQNTMRHLIGVATQCAPDSDEVMTLTHALFGQTLGFLISREAYRRGLKGQKIEHIHLGMMQTIIRANIEAVLNAVKP